MANTIKLKRTSTPANVPTTVQLALGEIAINTYDGKVYIKKDDGVESIIQVNQDTTDHTALSNIGTNTHAQIDDHIADTGIHFTQAAISITESQISDLGSYSVTSHVHEGTAIDATAVTDGYVLTADGAGNAAWEVAPGLLNLVEDLTPQLGGNLDLNGYAIPQSMQTQTGTTYVPVLGDAEKIITMNNAAANTVTIPANSSVAYPVGTKLNFMQLGAGATTVAITTDTLNVNSALTLVLNGQYAIATALKLTSTSWVLFGALVAA